MPTPLTSRIHEAITRAALDPEAWQGVPDAVLAAFPGTKTAIVGHDAALVRNIPGVYSGYDPAFAPSYAEHYSRVIPHIDRWAALPLGPVAHVWEIMEEEELVRSEYYNDWVLPQAAARQSAIAVLQRDPGRFFLFTSQVEDQVAGGCMDAVMQTMRSIYPMMRHALEINRMMLGLRIDNALLRLGLEPEGAAILLLGRQGAILYANARAEALLAEGQVIRHDTLGRLCLVDEGAERCLTLALDPRAERPGAAFRLGPANAAQDVRFLRIRPEALRHLALPILMRSPVPEHLLVLRPVAARPDEAGPLIAQLGLTQAEADVALALTAGATIAEIAEARRASIGTVRHQVKAAMAKTVSRRQSDLVRAVLGVRRPN
jgi:DNA-binding CsgD family transcriptional regulator